MTVTDELLADNRAYAESFSGPLPLPPATQVAVVACMDARLDVYRILGLAEGEAQVIRNAGGVVADIVTDDETGLEQTCSAETFSDLDTDVRESVARITRSPFVPRTDQVRGSVLDVATGALREVA